MKLFSNKPSLKFKMNFNPLFDETIHYLNTIHGQVDTLIENKLLILIHSIQHEIISNYYVGVMIFKGLSKCLFGECFYYVGGHDLQGSFQGSFVGLLCKLVII